MSVMENDEKTPPLIGYIVLDVLDFVVAPQSEKLIPNPEYEGKWMAELYQAGCYSYLRAKCMVSKLEL